MWMLGQPLLMKVISRNLLYERFETAPWWPLLMLCRRLPLWRSLFGGPPDTVAWIFGGPPDTVAIALRRPYWYYDGPCECKICGVLANTVAAPAHAVTAPPILWRPQLTL